MKKPKVLTTDDIKKMTEEEIMDLLLYKSFFDTSKGPTCKCKVMKLTRFMGDLPNELCEKTLEEVDLSSTKPFESKVSSTCPCQESHFFRIFLKKGKLKFEETEGKVVDTRKVNLPNYRK